MANRFAVPVTQLVLDDTSGSASGWLLNFYTTGTTTRKNTFSDNGLTTANANPVVADASGRFGNIFLGSGDYKVVLTDGDNLEKWTADPVAGSVGATGAVDAKTAAYTITTGDATKTIAVDATSGALTVTLPAAASATNGFEVTVKKTDSSVNAVTIDGNGAETIDGATTLVLSNQYDSATLRCDGSNWFVVAADRGGLGRSIFWEKGADIASAAPLVLGTDGNYFDVTGTTGFAAITVRAGMLFMLQFDGALTLTHHATNLDLPGEADITTAAGDVLIGFATGADTTQVLSYTRADGRAVASGAKGADIASADPLVLGTDGNYFDVTGTTGFASITVTAGTLFMLQFDGALTLTHHATNLDLPGEANITTAAGDVLIGFATGANTVQVVSYTKADGKAVVAATAGITSIANTSITATTNIDFTGFASGTYDNYEVWVSNVQPANDGVILEMETSTDGGTSFDTGVSDYTWAVLRFTEAGSRAGAGDPDDSEIEISGGTGIGNAANENLSAKILVFSPETTEFTSFSWNGIHRDTAAVLATLNGAADRQSAADVDGLRFHWSAGDWVAQGSIQFLGIAQ